MRLHNFLMRKHVENALQEDIGYGDISTDYIPNYDKLITVYLNTRVDGVLCGTAVFETVFDVLKKCDDDVKIEFYFSDGDLIKKGDKLAKITGKAGIILTAERVSLNYIQRMSGIATHTAKYVAEIADSKAQIVDTRKNTPGFRIFEKYSVKTGGGSLHRFNLSDCVMLKDNHIAIAGSITNAVAAVKKDCSHAHKIEVECDTFEQVQEALTVGADIIMLDNMNNETIKKCIETIKDDAIIEVSGNVTLQNIKSIASLGVDIISSSAIITKAPTLDLGLDF